jgi:hypothetical protein
MADYLLGQMLCGAVLIIYGCFLVWRYNVIISRKVELEAFQYRIFAVRDRVIRLVAEGKVSEDDEQWKYLYEHVNFSAHWIHVDKMRKGTQFVLSLLRSLEPPSRAKARELSSMPEALRQEWVEYATAVMSICWDGSRALRNIVRAGTKIHSLAVQVQKFKPKETSNYRKWKNVSQSAAPA